MVNIGQILGRVGRIETRPINSGSVTNISMVTSKKYMKDGQKQEKTTWHNVTCFGKVSEIAEKFVKVGDLLFIQGEMDNQKYTGKDGIERTKFSVIANDLKLLPKAKEHKPEPKTESFPDFDVLF
jgi:single-strand DNA-binding protein